MIGCSAMSDAGASTTWLLLTIAGLAVLFLLGVAVPVWLGAADHCYGHHDFGIYSQGIAGLARGELNPWLSGRQISLFGDHFDPVLFIVAPIAALASPIIAGLGAETLAVLLSFGAALWLHRKGHVDTRATLLICALLWFNPGIISAVRFPVHPTTWAALPMAFLVCALYVEQRAVILISLLALFACKEEFPLVGLAIGTILFARGERRFGGSILALSATWLAVVFGIRPWLVGETHPYAATLTAGLFDAPIDYAIRRLTVPRMWSRIGSMVLVLAPVALFAFGRRRRPSWLLLAPCIAMLAVRFLGMTWRHHYGAPLMAAAIGALLPLLRGQRIPRWVLVATGLLLVSTNLNNLRFGLAMYGEHDSGKLARCADLTPRHTSINGALDRLLDDQRGAALVGGNLFAALAVRPNIYVAGGPQPSRNYRFLLVEKPPRGDVTTALRTIGGDLIDRWRRDPNSMIITDDEHVFFAERHATSND